MLRLIPSIILAVLSLCSPLVAAPAVELRLRQAEADPMLASPEELTEILEACRELDDNRCEARALLLMGGPGVQEALEIARGLGDRSLEGRAICSLATADLNSGDHESVWKRLEQMEDLEAEQDLPRVTGCRAYVEGLALASQGQQAEARAVWDGFAGSEISERAPREKLWALIGGTVASFSALSDLQGAVSRGRRARELADRLPGLTDRARTYTNLAIALSISGIHGETGEVASIGLELSRQAGMQSGEAICLRLLGSTAHQMGDRQSALRLCGESLELAAREADRFYALLCIASALHSDGRFEEAVERSQEAISIADGLGAAGMRAHARNILSMAYLELGDPGRAEEIADEALALLGPEGNALTRAWALKTRGMARSNAQRHSLSFDDLEEAFRLFGSLGNISAQARVAIDMGNVQYYLNRVDRALDYYEQAVELARKAGAIEVRHIALSNLALAKRRFGRISESRELLLEQAAEIDGLDSGALSANTLLNLAEALDEIGEAPEAERLAIRALQTAAVHESAMLLARAHAVLAGARSSQGRHDEAFSHCGTALKLSSSLGPWTTMDLHWSCGNVLLDGGRVAEGRETLRKALRIGEDARSSLEQPDFRASFLSDRTELNVDLVRAVLYGAGPEPPAEVVEEAFEISERFRAWTLLDALAGERREEQVGSERRGELLAQMAEIHLEMMGAAEERRAEQLHEVRKIEDRLSAVTRSPRDTAVLGGSSVAESEIRELFPESETAFLEYLIGSNAAFLFTVSREGIRVVELPRHKDEIEHDVRIFRGLIERRGPDPERDRSAIRTVGERLYRTLIAPAVEMLGTDIRRLVICPDGALHLLPFDTLVVPGEGTGGPVRYLVEDLETVIVPSLGVFAQLQREEARARETPQLVAFANPRPLAAEYPPLPYSEEEVEIAAWRLGGEARIHTGSEATEEQARRSLTGGHRVVHFAGHGFLDAGSIGRSGLVLAPDPVAGDDGLLQAREVVDLDIGAGLVILSGCSTGGGRLLPGEGPMGLPHAFFQAGAPSILMSLWDVRDRAAAIFMDRFYAGLAEGCTYGDAVRKAKLDLLASGSDELRHPSVWAPFVMAGLTDRYLDTSMHGEPRRSGVTVWIIGFLMLAIVLWIFSAVLRRRSRSAPSTRSR
jgi:CHAT domain-containing protein/tetratricopeptide (TPR) repeat protein